MNIIDSLQEDSCNICFLLYHCSGKELHRVRLLNVLNRPLPDRQASVPAQIRLPMGVVPEEQGSGFH